MQPRHYLFFMMTAIAAGQPFSPIAPIAIRDLTGPRHTIAFIGDSYASGEGAPNQTGAKWDDRGCHRSSENGRAAAAKAVAATAGTRLNPITMTATPNLIWKDVACSGATVAKGILGRYEGVDELNNNTGGATGDYGPQVNEVEQWLNGRELDVLSISVGGNDVGFAKVVETCMHPFKGNCHTDNELKSLVANGDPNDSRVVGFAGLEQKLRAMKTAIDSQLKPRKVIFFGYPNPLRDRKGSLCNRYDENFAIFTLNGSTFNPGPGALGFHIGAATEHLNAEEAAWVESELITKMNNKRRDLAEEFGWTFIDPTEMTRRHGFCASGNRAWFNTPKTSYNRQGDFNGTAHPNREGFKVYEAFLMRELTRFLDIRTSVSNRLDHEDWSVVNNPPASTSPTGSQASVRTLEQSESEEEELELHPTTEEEAFRIQLNPPPGQQPPSMGFSLVLNGTLFPNPDVITEIALEVSQTSFEFNVPESSIFRIPVPVKQFGAVTAKVNTLPYAPNTILNIRWRVKTKRFYDATEERILRGPQIRIRVKGAVQAEQL